MNTHKTMILSLILLILPMIHGCSNENREIPKKPSPQINPNTIDREKIAKVEAKIYSELKSINGNTYKDIINKAFYEENKDDYNNINLLSVKIINNKIKLFYDESLLPKTAPIESITDFIYSTTYYIAEKNKIDNAVVKIYVNNRLLEDILE